jgi:hypothetical protein
MDGTSMRRVALTVILALLAVGGFLAALMPLGIGAMTKSSDSAVFIAGGTFGLLGFATCLYAIRQLSRSTAQKSIALLLIAVLLFAPAAYLTWVLSELGRHPP